jgi:ribose-phosphate pyrophosphokinase
MRNTLIFAGNSCPELAGQICENLGMNLGEAELTQFSNVSFAVNYPPLGPCLLDAAIHQLAQGETSVRILTSVREKDVFVVQSGSPKINDSIMELLITISACKGGSANKITGTY